MVVFLNLLLGRAQSAWDRIRRAIRFRECLRPRFWSSISIRGLPYRFRFWMKISAISTESFASTIPCTDTGRESKAANPERETPRELHINEIGKFAFSA